MSVCTTFIQSSIPHSLTLDLPRGLLYWTDSGLKTVSRVTYDGQQRKTVVEPNSFLEQPAGLAVFESRVYWIDGLTGSICSADKHWGKLLQVIKISSRSPAGFIIYHPLLQPTVSDATNSPAQTSTVDAKPASFTWILPLIGQFIYVFDCDWSGARVRT
ncbi:low-density lipoprotein receptor-like [Trichomycterus rosablanca]|uniref:low-density lipoprotein receptor-like n=1 Tax=Trichomycterus rosablanca TaxID=2290929 RepID=UPI002F35D7CB